MLIILFTFINFILINNIKKDVENDITYILKYKKD